MAKQAERRARLYHLRPDTIKKLDALAVLFGGHNIAVESAISATYEAAGNALKKMKVKRVKVPA
ncbi:MAG TPA: hypothetical protein VNU21_09235 [Usitatibacter sp.]|jgi:hypothetical protein|nr:hypothetical protein [Usitatibacter sp.]